ncbi:MAG: 50S ribosomal protein L29 [Candidatus Thermoplasmatota archaeon]|nr:50S ribosomal protein L29 [Candidatus Thermoplasmatota archaeon]
MPLIKTSDLKGMTAEERAAKLEDYRKELMYERGVAAMGGAPANPGRIQALRKSIAKVLGYESQLKKQTANKEEK